MPLPPIDAVLAASDLEESTDAVVAAAADAARRSGAALHVVHVLETMRRWTIDDPADPALAPRIDEARRRAAEQLARVRAAGADARIVVHAGTPHEEILARAEAVGAGLVVVGAHRGGALHTHFLGTTAERVIHGSGVPCMVVKEPLAFPLPSIGVPTDVRDPAPGAVEAALAWSALLAADGPPPPVRIVYAGWRTDAEDDPGLEARVVAPALDEVAAGAVEAGADGAARPRVTTEVVWGRDPAGEIARWAASEAVGLLVLATRGTGGLRRVLAGSVAQSIARQAPCPVMLLPPGWWEGG